MTREVVDSLNLGTGQVDVRQTTDYAYDINDHVVQQAVTKNGESIVTAYEYDAKDRVVCQTVTQNGEARVTTLVYDAEDRVVQTTDPDGNVTLNEYDAITGRLLFEILPAYTRASTYDTRGRVATVTISASNLPSQTVSYAYDLLGNMTNQIDALGRVAGTRYDVLGHVVSSIDTDSASVREMRYEYDIKGRMTALIDANSNETAWAYDDRGRMTQKTYADATTYAYGYDQHDQLTNRVDAMGQVTEYVYDPAGNLANVVYRTAAGAAVAETISTYDARRRLVAVAQASSSGTNVFAFSYDDTNHARTVSVDYGDGPQIVNYQDDVYGRTTAFAFVGHTNTYIYNHDGRIVGIGVPGIGDFSYTYDTAGRNTEVTLPGGGRKILAYGTLGSMMTNVMKDVAGNDILRQSYERNALQNLVATHTELSDRSYAYDFINQLTNAVYTYQAPPDTKTFAYAYDPMGNRQRAKDEGQMTEYEANNLNQYSEISNQQSQITLAYDLNGNLTNDGSRVYAWDIENRLIAVEPLCPTNGAKKVAMAYDFMSRRISKKVSVWDTDHWSLTSAYSFIYDGWNLIQELITDNGSPSTNSYIWGLDLSGTLQGAGGIGGLLAATFGGSNTVFYCYDHNGNIEKLITPNGATVATYEYDPYGNLLSPVMSFCTLSNDIIGMIVNGMGWSKCKLGDGRAC